MPTSSSTGRKWFLLGLAIVIQLACWRGSSKLRSSSSLSSSSSSSLTINHNHSTSWYENLRLRKRNLLDLHSGGSLVGLKGGEQEQLLGEREGLVEQVEVEVGESSNKEKEDEKEEKKEKKKKEKEEKKHKKKEKKNEKKHKSKFTSSTSESTSSTHTTTITTTIEKPTATSESTSSTSSKSSTKTSTSPTPTPPLPCDPLPLQLSPPKLCAHVRKHCPPSGHFDYLGFFYCQGVEEGRDPDSHSSTSSSLRSSSDSSSISDQLSNNTTSNLNSEGSIEIEFKNRKGKQELYPISREVSILRSLALAIIIGWMLFLFSGVGIVASDFFCPNLSTIASRLGLNESTAGVTFLAFGNGSPDVFSTFGAMKSGSGSLAIGELLGAASFIVSVISGSMMLIKPFRVKAFPFLRDVGFFTVAVALTMSFLLDGRLRLSESLCLIGLYIIYAATVIIGSWWQERRRRKRLMIATARSEYSIHARSRQDLEDEEDEIVNPFRDDEDGVGGDQESKLKTPSRKYRSSSVNRSTEDLERQSGMLSVPSPYLAPISPSSEYDPEADPLELWADTPSAGMRAIAGIASAVGAPSSTPAGSPRMSPSPIGSASSRTGRGESQLSSLGMMRSQSKFRPGANPRHSLLGAIEFRDVVRSLRAESNYTDADDRSLEVFQSRDPESFYPHHHNHPHHHHQSQNPQERPRHQRSETHAHRRIASMMGPSSALEPSAAYEYSRERAYSTGNRGGRPAVHRSRSTGNHLRTADDGDHYFASFHGNGIGSSSGSGSGSGEASGFASLVGSRERDAAAGTTGEGRGIDVGAATAGLDDPWREEHTVNDNCEDAAPPPSNNNLEGLSKSDQLRLGLPKIGTHQRNVSEEFLLPPSADHHSDKSRSPVPSIHISKSGRSDEEYSSPGTPTPQPTRSKSNRAGKRSRSDSTPNGTSLMEYRRLPNSRTSSESFQRHLKMTRRALFPSLRHFREKSWLGIIVSVITAPALFALNLTLPVVDDEAERQREFVAEGELRLSGSETDLRARKAFLEEEEEDERIIDLGGDPETTPTTDRIERVHRAENSERDRELAHALGKVPLGESSVKSNKLGHSRNNSKKSNGTVLDPVNENNEDDGASECSVDSCSTSSSIFGDSASTANSELFPAQCILAPPFCTWAIVSSSGASEKSVRNKVILAFFFGLTLSFISLLATLRAKSKGGSWLSKRNILIAGNVRCGIGFIVSVMWIMTIVDEVVSILQTIGIIVGLSDAILGLTVFAIGNSLGDLVANVTIAKMGHPVMAISACFAGPLLNLLLGIGISGSWILSRPTSNSLPSILEDGIYKIDFSPTLIVSGLGLLTILIGTLIAVPMNGFLLSRKLGTCLIASYACIMVTNILVEVFYASP